MPPAIRTRVLILVKTYPTLSRKYGELVCTAGMREDGSWIRLYPIRFRELGDDKRFKKFNWIEADIEKSTSDDRPESHRVSDFRKIELVGEMETGKDWTVRCQFVLRKVRSNLAALIAEARDRKIMTSLATFKPSRIHGFVYEKADAEWNPVALEQFKQANLFEDYGSLDDLVEKIPWKFSIRIEDDSGRSSQMMVEDWEICQLYRNLIHAGRAPEDAAIETCDHYMNLANTRDMHLFLGTTKEFHSIGPNPFIVIGVFYPPKRIQLDLLDFPSEEALGSVFDGAP